VCAIEAEIVAPATGVMFDNGVWWSVSLAAKKGRAAVI
jgi:hypothetical protein